jgi:hypothetical protein
VSDESRATTVAVVWTLMAAGHAAEGCPKERIGRADVG